MTDIDISDELAALKVKYQQLTEWYEQVYKERDEYARLLFQPIGESHHNANECPYCKENLK